VARLAIRQASHGREAGTSNAAAIRSLMMWMIYPLVI
jgi:hypothetical protein